MKMLIDFNKVTELVICNFVEIDSYLQIDNYLLGVD